MVFLVGFGWAMFIIFNVAIFVNRLDNSGVQNGFKGEGRARWRVGVCKKCHLQINTLTFPGIECGQAGKKNERLRISRSGNIKISP